jgi:hypothetical protein
MTPTLRKSARPVFEALEARLVPASTLVNGVLTATGGDMADNIAINPVSLNGMSFVRVNENGVETDYPADAVRRVRVFGNGGDDTLSNNVAGLNAALSGGDGRDLIYGDNGRDYLDGGAGRDTLHGWGGSDTLVGGQGADNLYGEDGYDRLYGGIGSDWLNAGSRTEPAVGGPGWDFNAYVWAYNGARITDINQTAASTCVFLSSLGGIAHTGLIDLARQINYVGDDTYTVRLFVAGMWQDVAVRFNGDVTADDTHGNFDCMSDREGEFWPLLYQRAYMWVLGYDPYSAASMATFDGEWNGNQALAMISGWASQTTPIDAGTNPDTLRGLLGNGYAINSLYAGHEYAVTNVFRSGGNWYVRLYNPWGEDRVHNPNLHPRPDGVNDGFMTITWANFTGTFFQYSWA